MRPAPPTDVAPIERASANDLMQRAADVGPLPAQVGALIVLDEAQGLDAERIASALESRLATVPRLWQHLVDAPIGCGRPFWLADLNPSAHDHLTTTPGPASGELDALTAVAGQVIAEPLPRDRSPWRATLVEGLPDRRAALVVVFDHVLADGIGGLAILASLVDGEATGDATADATGDATNDPPVDLRVPRSRPPTAIELAADAWRERARALAHLCTSAGARASIDRLRAAFAELGPTMGVRSPRTSLSRPVGIEREIHVALAPLDALVDVAHARGATLNDVAVHVATGALGQLLHERGEDIHELVVSMPVSGRQHTTAAALGNQVGVMPVAVPIDDRSDRLERIAARTRAHKTDQPGASAVLVVPVMRVAGALGLLRPFIERQRSLASFLTNLRGPAEPQTFLGARITNVIPMTGIYGNVAVAFAVMSYAGALTITIISDAAAVPDGPELRRLVQDQLDLLVADQSAIDLTREMYPGASPSRSAPR